MQSQIHILEVQVQKEWDSGIHKKLGDIEYMPGTLKKLPYFDRGWVHNFLSVEKLTPLFKTTSTLGTPARGVPRPW